MPRFWLRVLCLFLGLTLSPLSPGSGRALAGGGAPPCPASTGAVALSVVPIDSQVTYVLDRSEAELATLNTRRLAPNVHLRGLTVDHLVGRLELKYQATPVGTGWCLMPTAIISHAGFQDMTVYIDRKYPKDTCQRRAVALHENKHVTINYEEMNAGFAQIETDLRAALAAAALPIHVADPKAGAKYLSDYFSYYLNRDIQQITDRMERRNTALDNPQEYAGITALCPVW